MSMHTLIGKGSAQLEKLMNKKFISGNEVLPKYTLQAGKKTVMFYLVVIVPGW